MAPITQPAVAEGLLKEPRAPRCALPAANEYTIAQVDRARLCEQAAKVAAVRHHGALAAAVRVREKAAAEIVQAAR